jgi:hypothetical protein
METSAIELVRRCDAILASGEITENDAYDLADWLNHNREACGCWPGETLVSRLQQIWADSKVNKTELRQLGALLRSIHKQWTQIFQDEAWRDAELLVQELAPTMPPTVAELPPIPIELRVRSHSDPSQFYNVDLSGPTCDCGDWRGYRQHLPVGHLTRCCKHVIDAFAMLVPEHGWRGWIGAFIHTGWPAYPRTEWKIIDVDGCTWLASIPKDGSQWMNFYADEACFEKFAYSAAERRWSYHSEPNCAARLLLELHLSDL